MDMSLSGSILTVTVDGHSDSVTLASISNPLQGTITIKDTVTSNNGFKNAFTYNPTSSKKVSGYRFSASGGSTQQYFNAEGISASAYMYASYTTEYTTYTVRNTITGKPETQYNSDLNLIFDGIGTGYVTFNLYFIPYEYGEIGSSSNYVNYAASVTLRIINGEIISYSSKYSGSATYYGFDEQYSQNYPIKSIEVSY